VEWEEERLWRPRIYRGEEEGTEKSGGWTVIFRWNVGIGPVGARKKPKRRAGEGHGVMERRKWTKGNRRIRKVKSSRQ
jgi:hypothetical protein